MDIRYTRHALEKLSERTRISKAMIETTLTEPDEVVEGRGRGKIAQRVFDAKLLRVIYKGEDDHVLVITAYLADPARYLEDRSP